MTLLRAQVELVKITAPQDSRSEHETLTQHAEAVLKVSRRLDGPYHMTEHVGAFK